MPINPRLLGEAVSKSQGPAWSALGHGSPGLAGDIASQEPKLDRSIPIKPENPLAPGQAGYGLSGTPWWREPKLKQVFIPRVA